MSELEWTNCPDPTSMLEFVRDASKRSDRKFRLFAISCCRRIQHLLDDERSRNAFYVAEQYADGLASDAELFAAALAANAALYPADRSVSHAVSNALNTAHLTTFAPHTLDAFVV